MTGTFATREETTLRENLDSECASNALDTKLEILGKDQISDEPVDHLRSDRGFHVTRTDSRMIVKLPSKKKEKVHGSLMVKATCLRFSQVI